MLKDILKDKIKNYILDKDICGLLKIKKDFEVSFLAQGEYNINFTVDDGKTKYVFRVNTGSQLVLEHQIDYEFNAIKNLEISGVTPRGYYVDGTKEYLDYGVLIMEFLYGNPLEYNRDLERAARIFGKIHSIDTRDYLDDFIVESNICSDRIKEGRRLLKDYLESPKVDKELKQFFTWFLDWAEANKHREKYFKDNKWHVINNTEVNSHNFIIGNDRSYLIDWEKPVISDPAQDLTQFLADTTTQWKANYILSKEEKDKFFKAYREALGGNDNNIRERVHLYDPYLYLRALSWCAYAWLEYQNPDKDIKNMDTFRRIEQYLDAGYMKGLLREYV